MSLWGIQSNCPTCGFLYIMFLSFYDFIMVYLSETKTAIRVRGDCRIGPHNKDIISILYGSLLGDAHAEKRAEGKGTRISFYQEGSHSEYLLWLHSLIASLGYCNTTTPKLQTRMGAGGKIRYIIRFHSFTYTSFNSLYDAWYVNGIKHVPLDIADYLTPLALAIWIMDDGCRSGHGLKLATNSFTFSDCLRLTQVLFDLYGIKATVQKAGAPQQFHIYIWVESLPILRSIVRPHMVSSMLYKLAE